MVIKGSQSMQVVNIKVIPNSRKTAIINEKDFLKVYLKEQPLEGKAKKALIDVLSEYFNVRKSNIEIIKGKSFRKKVVKIFT
ncbi:DUF167 domain-containing protein [Candidatus Woesearchaeota archaeon]|nr:DUF167 domain-containing protein [Candidatus Woesearchaeota archaeon]